MKKKETTYVERTLTQKNKYQIGERVAGSRTPFKYEGVITRAYYTVNGSWLNPAYVILCDDGRRRSFQHVSKLPCNKGHLVDRGAKG